jgi:hypothetical protein
MTLHEVKMIRYLAVLCLALFGFCAGSGAEVLIVADEFPAMEVLGAKLKGKEKVDSKIISQGDLPASLTNFETVIVYIHGKLEEKTEVALIDYAKSGGKLVVVHHSISSTKRKNAQWFSFLGVELPEGPVEQGGYKWIGDVSWDLANLNSNHFIMTNLVTYPSEINYEKQKLRGFTLDQSEVYLNHVLTEPRTILMGLKYHDLKTGTVYTAATAGWIKRSGKGWTIYLMPGHSAKDFEDPAYSRIVLNAVIFKPLKSD